jgi:hypothetical protein
MDMTKYEMAVEIAALSGESGLNRRSIINHQMKRPISAVRESLARQRAIARVTRREIILHCQPPIPPAPVRANRIDRD